MSSKEKPPLLAPLPAGAGSPISARRLHIKAFAQRHLPELVVQGALVRIPEHLVRAIDGLEALLCPLVVGVAIGMELRR